MQKSEKKSIKQEKKGKISTKENLGIMVTKLLRIIGVLKGEFK